MTKAKMLTAADIRRKSSPPKRIELDGFDGYLYFKSPSAGLMVRALSAQEGSSEQVDALIEMAVEAFCDAKGAPAFTREEIESFDFATLVELTAAIRLGAEDETTEDAGDAEKNS